MQVPLTAMLLLFELTHDYNIVLFTLGAVGMSFWLASLPETTSLLARWLPGGPEPKLPARVPWQATVDAQSVSEQLGMQVSTPAADEVRVAHSKWVLLMYWLASSADACRHSAWAAASPDPLT